MPHVVIVSGNPAKVSRLNGLTGFVRRKLAERHFAVDVLHVADLPPKRALEHKVVLPLLIGGSIAHLLAVEYALKPVLSVLGARIQLAGVYAVDQWIVRAEDGGYDLKLVERLSAAAWFAGLMLTSYPGQAMAIKIEVIP